MNPAIALQLVWSSYDGQQRPFTSKKDTKKRITYGPEFVFQIALTICLKILQGAREGSRVGKVNIINL